jgi:hypothetical protein
MFTTVLVKYVMPDSLSPTTYSHDSKLGFKGLCEEVSEPDNVNPLLTKIFIKGITSTNRDLEPAFVRDSDRQEAGLMNV